MEGRLGVIKGETLGESNDMYLLTVFRLVERGGEVSISHLAEATGHSMSTVSEKVRRLTRRGYLLHEWRGAVTLSAEGWRYAGRLLRKRRLIETFLVCMAGYNVYDVHVDACRLEHVISDRLTDALERMLDYPRHDPHGHPIPDKEGAISTAYTVSLSMLDEGGRAEVVSLNSEDMERLKYLDELGFSPGVTLRLLHKAPFDGPLTIDMNGFCFSLAVSLASTIDVVVQKGLSSGTNGMS